jgi:DinB superfamily
MNPDRQRWNKQHQVLRKALSNPAETTEAVEIFLSLHAMVHSAEMSQSGLWSFEDEVWQDLPEEAVSSFPPGGEHSIAWIVWHLSRIEDMTMNVLVAGGAQVWKQEGWQPRLKITLEDTGNALNLDEIAALSASVDVTALRAYRLAVGRRTRQIVKQLGPADFKRKTDPLRLRRLLDEGAVVAAAGGLLEYWGGLTVAGLLLMPPTRHNIVHWNEALRIKSRLG